MKKLLVFTAQWCGACKMLKPILAALADENLINLQMVDVDEQRAHASQMGVRSIPALFFYNDDVVYESAVGFMPREKVLEIYNREVVDSLGEDLEIDIIAEVDKILAEERNKVLTPPSEDPLMVIEPEVEGEEFVDLEKVLPEPDEEVVFTPPHTIFDEQPEEELVVEDVIVEDVELLPEDDMELFPEIDEEVANIVEDKKTVEELVKELEDLLV